MGFKNSYKKSVPSRWDTETRIPKGVSLIFVFTDELLRVGSKIISTKLNTTRVVSIRYRNSYMGASRLWSTIHVNLFEARYDLYTLNSV